MSGASCNPWWECQPGTAELQQGLGCCIASWLYVGFPQAPLLSITSFQQPPEGRHGWFRDRPAHNSGGFVQAIQTQARSDLMLPRAADWGQCAVLTKTACSDALIFLVRGSYIGRCSLARYSCASLIAVMGLYGPGAGNRRSCKRAKMHEGLYGLWHSCNSQVL